MTSQADGEGARAGGARARGQQTFPGVRLTDEAFDRHVARLALNAETVDQRASDLYLVFAVIEGDGPGLVVFDQLIATAARIAARVDPSPAFIDEVAQELRMRLLVGAAPKIATYTGAGALGDWLRVTALRTALNLKRSDHLLPVDEIPIEAVIESPVDLEVDRRFLPDLSAAISAGFETLNARERMLLRLHFVDGCSTDRLGAIYGVHRTTVARWLIAIRDKLFAAAKAELGAKHGFESGDLRSLYRRIADEVHLTISRILRG